MSLPPPDTRLAGRDEAALRARVTLSAGTIPAEGADAARPAYGEGARVPAPPWRPPSDDAWRALFVPAEEARALPPYRSVAVLRLDGPELDALMAEGARAAEMPLSAYEHSQAEGARAAVEAVARLLGAEPGSVRSLGFSAKRAGLATTTVNDARRRRAGLHLDRFDRAPLERLHETRMRVNVNLGAHDRHFLYCAHSVRQMAGLVPAVSDPGEIGRAFLSAHPGSPVIRLALRPGEAYLAATEALVHDATTLGNEGPWDLHCSILCRLPDAAILDRAL